MQAGEKKERTGAVNILPEDPTAEISWRILVAGSACHRWIRWRTTRLQRALGGLDPRSCSLRRISKQTRQLVEDMSWVDYYLEPDRVGASLIVPVAPLQRAADIPSVFNQPWMNDSHGPLDLPPEQGIPTMITWNYGGKDVAVEGSWDNWTSRKTLQRSGKDHSILLVLPSGIYQYKFIVDGEWRYIPDLPCVADEMGLVTNLLDVHDYMPENLESVAEFEAPPSPDSSYGHPLPVDEDFSKEPLAVPSQLHLTILGMPNPAEVASSLKPQHVVLNHLYIEKGWAPQSLVALGLTHRFQSKYVTVILYKPLRR